MDQRLGDINLIRWQGRRNRRLKSGVSGWTIAVVVCAIAGSLMLGAQLLGLLPRTGLLAAAPAGLVLLALCSQILAVTRAVLAWLAG